MEFWLVASNPPTVRPDGGLLELESHECAVGILRVWVVWGSFTETPVLEGKYHFSNSII